MKRLIDQYLLAWKKDAHRKSLLIHGARQIGKTYAVRQLGATYKNFIEINFERKPELAQIFDLNLVPERIVKELSEALNISISTDDTLLFFDEIQVAPKAIIALRYFYEEMHDLHVVAAGSLVDFAIQQVGIPVGRVQELDMYPLSFLEFLWATGHDALAKEIMDNPPEKSLNPDDHYKALDILGEYIAVGGMPEAVKRWRDTKNLTECFTIFETILRNYQQDFSKYAKKYQLKYLNDLFKFIPQCLGNQFKYTNVPGEYRKQELAPCLDLLETAGIIHRVVHSAGQGIPLGALSNHDIFKVIFLDIALSESMLGLPERSSNIHPLEQLVNKGGLVEAFVGQELLAYTKPNRKAELYYWHKTTGPETAEIDYLIQGQMNAHDKTVIIPIEVKSGPGTTLKSMHSFLEKHPESPIGIRFSMQNHSIHGKIHSYPLYAIPAVIKHYGQT